MSDLQDESTQAWKSYAGWGSYNILAFCCTHLPDADIPEHIGLLLPPTLMMLDDWEQAWRGRAVWVLSKWIGKVPADTMRRMGIDKLLIKSLLHTLSLHPNPPLPHVLPLALDLIDRTTRGEQRADLLAEVMDKAILTGWLYAPSGPEGRAVLTQIARDLERMCEVIGWGILRWMKVRFSSPSGHTRALRMGAHDAEHHPKPASATFLPSDTTDHPALRSQPLGTPCCFAGCRTDRSGPSMERSDPGCDGSRLCASRREGEGRSGGLGERHAAVEFTV